MEIKRVVGWVRVLCTGVEGARCSMLLVWVLVILRSFSHSQVYLLLIFFFFCPPVDEITEA